jgi:hypothetical protein
LVGAVAAVLRKAGQRQADYFGRIAGPLVEVCAGIVFAVEDQMPGIMAAVEQRNIR